MEGVSKKVVEIRPQTYSLDPPLARGTGVAREPLKEGEIKRCHILRVQLRH